VGRTPVLNRRPRRLCAGSARRPDSAVDIPIDLR
jgi:hypothetical protein